MKQILVLAGLYVTIYALCKAAKRGDSTIGKPPGKGGEKEADEKL